MWGGKNSVVFTICACANRITHYDITPAGAVDQPPQRWLQLTTMHI